MKSLILIKQHPSVQLGHLYEHLFLRQVNQFFYDRGLFKFLDYAAHGTTYEQGGVIVVDCELYSDAAILLYDKIAHLHIDYGPDNQYITIGLFQLWAEEPYELKVSSKQKLLAELKLLDSTPWQHIDDFSMLDTTMIHKKHTPLGMTRIPQAKYRVLRLSLTLDETFAHEHRDLTPLFASVGRLLLLTVGNQLSANYGVYAGGELIGKSRPSSVMSELFVSPLIASTIDTKAIMQTTSDTITYICSDETLARLIGDLTSTKYTDNAYIAPNYNRLLQETGILIGTKSWQQIASQENITQILEHASLEIKFGRQKTTQPLF